MLGFFLSRALLMALGYLYPAYECYKAVEKVNRNIDQLLFWCQYWILVALLTVLERFGDVFISWLPMYDEAKLVFFIYLWYPKTKGTIYVYNSFLRPYLKSNEKEIDRVLAEMWNKGRSVATQTVQNAAVHGQTWFLEVLRYASAQSTKTQAAQTAKTK